MKQISGRVWKYGNAINTDVIFPGKYTYTISDPKEMARHALEDLDPEFAALVRPGDVILGEANFGCGSSREQAVICLKEAGVGAVVARSFARIFYRNCINMALPALVCNQAVDWLKTGDEVVIDLQAGEIKSGKMIFFFSAFPDAVLGILHAGGIVPYTKLYLRG